MSPVPHTPSQIGAVRCSCLGIGSQGHPKGCPEGHTGQGPIPRCDLGHGMDSKDCGQVQGGCSGQARLPPFTVLHTTRLREVYTPKPPEGCSRGIIPLAPKPSLPRRDVESVRWPLLRLQTCWLGPWLCASSLDEPSPTGGTVGRWRGRGAHTVLSHTKRRGGSSLAHYLDPALTVASLFCQSHCRDVMERQQGTRMGMVFVLLVCDMLYIVGEALVACERGGGEIL